MLLRWATLRPKTNTLYPFNEVGKVAAQNAAGTTGRVAIALVARSGTSEDAVEHRLFFDPTTGREIV